MPAELQEVVDRVLEKELSYLRSQVEGAVSSLPACRAAAQRDHVFTTLCRGVQRRDIGFEVRNSSIQGEKVTAA